MRSQIENWWEQGQKMVRLRQERDELAAKCAVLVEALENAKLFAKVVECWGRTDCEIYKHELKASADLSLERIDSTLDSTAKSCLADNEAQVIKGFSDHMLYKYSKADQEEDKQFFMDCTEEALTYLCRVRQQAGGYDE